MLEWVAGLMSNQKSINILSYFATEKANEDIEVDVVGNDPGSSIFDSRWPDDFSEHIDIQFISRLFN